MTTVAIYALSRTGHTAIFSWIQANWDGPVSMLNVEDKAISEVHEADHHVLILRNPYNWLASWFMGIRHWKDEEQIFHLVLSNIVIWKQHAREVLGETNFIPKAHHILYDSWCSDDEYRHGVAKDIGIGLDDKLFHHVPGGGSSWDGTKYDGRANEMDTLNRWQLMKDDKQYRELINDDELIELTMQIFNVEFPFKIT